MSNSSNNNDVVIRFGMPQTTQIPIAIGSNPIIIAALRVNTMGKKNPCIKLDFVTNISVFGVTAGSIKFQVYKHYENQTPPTPIGVPFIFGPIAIGNEPISFFVPDCDNSFCGANSCCIYTVEVSAAELFVGEIGHASFNNSMLCATIAYNGECQCNL